MPVAPYLSEVDLIEDDLVRVTYAPESCYEGEKCDDAQCELEVPL